MPSLAKLPQAEIDALIEYVQYLSIRGQTELYLIAEAVDEDAPLPLDLQAARAEGVAPAADSWRAAKKFKVSPPLPPPTATSEETAAVLARGREAFAGKASRCVECHGPEGRGDGPQAGVLYDDWNKRKLPARRRWRRDVWPAAFSCPSSRFRRGISGKGFFMAATGTSISISHRFGDQGDADAGLRADARQPRPARPRGHLASGLLHSFLVEVSGVALAMPV